MKTLRILILGLLFMAMNQPFVGKAQTGQPSSPVAEVVTPDIQALARESWLAN
ncbi:MAG TPA: hypothetical protein VH280_05405 [Verrucomicrobiae bacterium]|jgi:hypothetical protein|nr:hypothetical protein [Verrucomicrobiae bacterium]